MFKPALHVCGNSDSCWFEVSAALKHGNKSCTFNLRLPLCARKAMPLPAAPSGRGIAHVDYDCPVARRAFADVTLHCFYPPFSYSLGVFAEPAFRPRGRYRAVSEAKPKRL